MWIKPAHKLGPVSIVLVGSSGHLCQTKVLPAIALLKENNAASIADVIGLDLKRSPPDPNMEWLRIDATEEVDISRLVSRMTHLPAGRVLVHLAMAAETIVVFAKLIKPLLWRLKQHQITFLIEKPYARDAQEFSETFLKSEVSPHRFAFIDNFMAFPGLSLLSELSDRFVDQVNHLPQRIVIGLEESDRVGHRGVFYDSTGVINDMVGNHALQLAATTLKSITKVNASTAEILYKLSQFERHRTVIGQYRGTNPSMPGYRQEPGVCKVSRTPTYFSGTTTLLDSEIGNWDVAIHSGKGLRTQKFFIEVQGRSQRFRLTLKPSIELLQYKPGGKHSDVVVSKTWQVACEDYFNIYSDLIFKQAPGAGLVMPESIIECFRIISSIRNNPENLSYYPIGSNGPIAI